MTFGWLTIMDCECHTKQRSLCARRGAVISPALSDGFALNVGLEEWQVDRVHDCYNAAQKTCLPFKLFISFDMKCVDMTRFSPQKRVDIDYGSWTRVLLAPSHARPEMT